MLEIGDAPVAYRVSVAAERGVAVGQRQVLVLERLWAWKARQVELYWSRMGVEAVLVSEWGWAIRRMVRVMLQ